MSEKLTELYLDKYKQLERAVRNTYHLKHEDSISYYLLKQTKFCRYKDDIRYCQEVRNWLQHNERVNGEFAVTPNQAMIDFIDALISKIQKAPKCYDIAVKGNSIYTEEMSGSVKFAMKKMRKNLYTHIPITKDGVVVGVFDENSIFDYIAEQEIVCIDDDLTFADIQEYIGINNREMENFMFVKPNDDLEKLELEFEKYFSNGKRIGMVFVTMDGKSTSKLIGIITAWDIIAVRRKGK